jgi:glycosyltransferase involved in cell wall biosynthesis
LNKRYLAVVVIPAFNEKARIAKVILKTKAYADKVIVCDDGSTDRTSQIAKALGAKVVRHKTNMGYGSALSTLFEEARKVNPDAMVTLDADGQHDPRYIPKLIRPIFENNTDLVIGSRFLSDEAEEKLPHVRRVGIRLITKLVSWATYKGITDAQSGFRAYGRKALQALQPTEQGMGASTEILIKAKQANLNVKEVPVVVSYEGNTSKRNPIIQWFRVVLTTIRLISTRSASSSKVCRNQSSCLSPRDY